MSDSRSLSTDPLTGLPDERGLAAWGTEHVGLGDVTAYVLVADGPMGSEPNLVAAAKILRACVRETDLVARYAQDALAFVALGVGPTLAEGIRKRIAAAFTVRDGRAATGAPLRVLIGMASNVAQGPALLDNLLRRAETLCRAGVAAKIAAA